MKTRNEIAEKYKWNFEDMFASREAWEAAYSEVEKDIPSISALKGTLGVSAEKLCEAFDRLYAFYQKLELVGEYAFLMKTVDGGDISAQEMVSKVTTLSVKAGAAGAFFDPELMAIPDDTLASFMKYGPLQKYAHIIEDSVRLKDHVLDEKSEGILAQFGKITGNFSETYKMFTNVEFPLPDVTGPDGKSCQLTPGIFGVLRTVPDKAVRDEAFKGMFGTYGKFINTITCMYAGSVKKDNLIASLRGYPSARASALAHSNVPEDVYDSLISAIHDATPVMAKYLELRKKVMGLDSIDVYDLYTPLVKDVDFNMSYEEACDLVLKAVAPLGESYVATIRRAIDERWIDVYETPGKESGAFSSGVYGIHPYVKLNFSGTLNDAFTLAHELGHAMHSYMSSEKQDYANHDYKILVAEVASTCNEVLLTKYLLSVEKDKGRKAYILNHFLEGFRTTVFRQTLFAEFEHKAHVLEASGAPLTSESLSALYSELEKIYYPNAEFRDEIKYEWAYIPHFYRAYYVYQYATGFSSAVAIASGILESGDASDYLRFLTTGGSDYPINELKIAGVDLTSPEVVGNAMKMFDETIDELEKVLLG